MGSRKERKGSYISHVAEISLEIRDLDALAVAAKKIGLELRRGQQNYKWWGRSVGDYAIPAGFNAEELGKCEHALSIPGNDQAYEIGVVRRRDQKPGWQLLWDFYAGGRGLEAVVGKDACKLKQRYAAEVAMKAARKQGFRVSEKMQADGKIRLVCQR